MFWKLKRPNTWIGMVASCLCTVLWGYVLIWYASEGRDIKFPLIVTILFIICSLSEIMMYRKIRRAKKAAEAKSKTEVKTEASTDDPAV